VRSQAKLAFALAAALVWMSAPAAAAKRAPDFTLTDQFGHPYRLSSHVGTPIALFFGYTYCPDICPTTLASLQRAKKSLGPSGAGISIVFVTVDPERDSPPVLRRYIDAFDPSFVALTGSLAQLAPVWSAYHVQREKQPPAGGAYAVSHTAIVYFIGRDGTLRSYGEWSDPVASFAQSFRELL
jgi:protein SCO1/2